MSGHKLQILSSESSELPLTDLVGYEWLHLRGTDHIGEKVPSIVYFHATWCPDCEIVTPFVNELVELYGDRLEITGIHSPIGPAQITEITSRISPDDLCTKLKGYLFPVVLDQPIENIYPEIGVLRTAWKVPSYPAIALLGYNGFEQNLEKFKGRSAIRKLKRRIEQLLD